MAYDLARWGLGLLIFIILLIIVLVTSKKKGRDIMISLFVSIIISSSLLLYPVENHLYSFKSVEQIYNYRHHEDLVTYAECDYGVLTVGADASSDTVYYAFSKDEKGYHLLQSDNITYRSSKYGIYIIKSFGPQMIILTKINNSAYNGEPFKSAGHDYFYTVIDKDADLSLLTYAGMGVSLV
ncbi:MAG: hypothetical protein IJT03_02150 [Clostridia bacterium]|nr:hypothetical protein [Clostridia bacterium]